MALDQVVFADVSSLTAAGGVVEGAQSFQASRGADIRPINTFNRSKPALMIGVPTNGSGSFSYVCSNGTNSGMTDNWAAKFAATNTISVAGNMTKTGTDVATAGTLSFTGCTFAGQGTSMNVKGEMVMNVSFAFTDGDW